MRPKSFEDFLPMYDGLVKSLHPHNGLKTNGIQDENASRSNNCYTVHSRISRVNLTRYFKISRLLVISSL